MRQNANERITGKQFISDGQLPVLISPALAFDVDHPGKAASDWISLSRLVDATG